MGSELEEERTHLEQLATTLRRRLRVLETQQVHFGNLVPDHIVLELEDVAHQLAQVQADLRRVQPSPTDTHCPYLGLLTFQETDSAFFFGQDTLVSTLLQKVERATFLAVLGPSGSGKSSVVRAGLIPALKGGALPGSDKWRYLTLKPGSRPLNTLAAAFAAVAGATMGDIGTIRETLRHADDGLLLLADGVRAGQTDARLVLVVDQAEELWTLAPTEPAAHALFVAEQQQPFLDRLLTAARAPDQAVLTILTLRADFLHRALEHHDLTQWIGEHDVMVSLLQRDALAQAITRPAELVGCSFEPGLVDALIEQTLGQPGALPLLEYTLLELWKDRRPDGLLTWETFHRIGGIEGGLARHADAILAQQYTPEQQTELRSILLHLVQPGEGTVDTRRRAWLDDLVPVGSSVEAVQALLKPLADERLITTGHDPVSGEETVEISHEALIRAWPTLGTWVSQARADLRFQLQLEEAAREWSASHENPDFLWGGLRLANAEAWLDRTKAPLNALNQAFLAASQMQEHQRIAAQEATLQHELEQARALAASAGQLRRRARYLVGALAVTLVAVTIAGWYWYNAVREEQRAFAQYLIAKGQSVYETHPLLGVRLAIEGLAWLSQDDPAHSDVFNIMAQLAKQGRVQKLADDGSSIEPSPNHTMFLLGHAQAPKELWRADGTLVTRLAGDVVSYRFSPDSKLFIVSYSDTSSELRKADDTLITRLTDAVQNVKFSPDSKVFVVEYRDMSGELRSTDGTLITRLTDAVQNVEFSPDSKVFVVEYRDMSGELRSTDGTLITRLSGLVNVVVQWTQAIASFSPDSKVFVVGYGGGPGELRSTDGTLITRLGESYNVDSAEFSPDGKVFVVGYGSGPGELRSTDGTLITRLSGMVNDQSQAIASFSPDSKLFAVQYQDNSSALQVPDTSSELRGVDGSVVLKARIITLIPNHNMFAVEYGYDSDKPSELRSTDGNSVLLSGDGGPISFSPDSKFMVIAYLQEPGELRSTDGTLITRLAVDVEGAEFSSDSKVFMVKYRDKPSELWETQGSARPLATLSNLQRFTIDPIASFLIIQHSTGQVYVLDIPWLSTIASYPQTASETELIEQVCTRLLPSFQSNEKEFQLFLSFLGNRTPKGCQYTIIHKAALAREMATAASLQAAQTATAAAPTSIPTLPQPKATSIPTLPQPIATPMPVYKTYSAPPSMTIDPSKQYTATITTPRGDIVIKLRPDLAPKTVNSFVFLAKEGFYNGLTWHRVIPNFMAQGGDPTGLGTGGPGYTLPDEFTDKVLFDKPGIVAMVRADAPNSAGSQFFITTAPARALNGNFTIFGEVIKGQEIVNGIPLHDPTQNPTTPGEQMISITIDEQ